MQVEMKPDSRNVGVICGAGERGENDSSIRTLRQHSQGGGHARLVPQLR